MHPNVMAVITVIVNIIVITSIITFSKTIITIDCVSLVKSLRSVATSLKRTLVCFYVFQHL